MRPHGCAHAGKLEDPLGIVHFFTLEGGVRLPGPHVSSASPQGGLVGFNVDGTYMPIGWRNRSQRSSSRSSDMARKLGAKRVFQRWVNDKECLSETRGLCSRQACPPGIDNKIRLNEILPTESRLKQAS
ncbi:hypothetical protein PGT21_028807 [Puccinia graminis f. sp. tritici]|uniref:Uncharacterized protein n=1 Tax=Puccinia graminis f. sp. tritici TaxID=56615 RepID=A0A5B0MP41_PUCGR|nr:hypothetical protein PGT21_028807 [Puccinia graminis f. sp. tritici]